MILGRFFQNKPIEEASKEDLIKYILDQYDVGANRHLQAKLSSQKAEIRRLHEEVRRLKARVAYLGDTDAV